MCLDKLVEISVKKGYGYKVFRLYDEYKLITGDQEFEVPVGEWIEDSTRMDYKLGVLQYTPGFHILLNKMDAFYWRKMGSFQRRAVEVVRRVQFKDVVAQGTQYNGKQYQAVVVARKICIGKKDIKEVK